MTTTWIPDGTSVHRDGDPAYGDYSTPGINQVTDGYSIRFHLADEDGKVVSRLHNDDGDPRHGPSGKDATEKLYSMMEVVFYGLARLGEDGRLDPDSDGDAVIWSGGRIETMVCTDLGDPGGTERYCEYEHFEGDRFFSSIEDLEVVVKGYAEGYLKDVELFNRDFVWDGLAPWEKTVWPPS